MAKHFTMSERRPETAFTRREEALQVRVLALREFAKKMGESTVEIHAVASLSLNVTNIEKAEKTLDRVERFHLQRKLALLLPSAKDKATWIKIVSFRDELISKDAGTAMLEKIRLAIPALEKKMQGRQVFGDKTPMDDSGYSGST